MKDGIVDRIISGNEQLALFWGNSHGWAPKEAADLMSKSRLDWQFELSKTLKLWNFQESGDGQLILAWTNLGALIEGTLKLFLAVYYQDYVKNPGSFNYKGKIVDPDYLVIEKLKQFFKKNALLDPQWILYIDLVQQRRNAIHAFRDRPIGNETEFDECVVKYLDFLVYINNRLPYPDGFYAPYF